MVDFERCRCNLCHTGRTYVLLGPSFGICRTSERLQEWARFWGLAEEDDEATYHWSTEKGREKALSKLHRLSSFWTRSNANHYIHAARAKGAVVPMMVYDFKDKVEFRPKRPHLRVIRGGKGAGPR